VKLLLRDEYAAQRAKTISGCRLNLVQTQQNNLPLSLDCLAKRFRDKDVRSCHFQNDSHMRLGHCSIQTITIPLAADIRKTAGSPVERNYDEAHLS